MTGTESVRRRRFDLRSLELLWPIGVAILLAVVVVLVLQALGSLTSWNEVYGPKGAYTVDACETEASRLGSRIVCSGSLEPEGSTEPVDSTLIGPKSAFGSTPPRSGQVIEVYYRSGDATTTYPVEGRSIELARAMIAVVPLLFVAGGLGCWLLGWLLTHGASREDRERRPDHYRWPARFVLRSRGAMWALVGLAWLLVDRYAIDDLLGSAGLS